MKELEKKVTSYLLNRGLISKDDTVDYVGLKENTEIRPNEYKDVHVFRYISRAGEEFDPLLNYVLVDAKTNRLEKLLAHHFSEDIFED